VLAVFWILVAPTGALSVLLMVMSLAGGRLSAVTPVWLTLLAVLGVVGLLVWAHHVATAGGRPGAACGVVVLSWVLFAVVMFANGLAHQQTWQ
jgi:hypothetical protein